MLLVRIILGGVGGRGRIRGEWGRGRGWCVVLCCVVKVESFWVDVGSAGMYVYVFVSKTVTHQILIV